MPKLRGLHLLARDHHLLLARLFIALSILAIQLVTAVPASADWTPDTKLSTGTVYSDTPKVAVSGNNVHVVWADQRDNGSTYQVYYKRSTDGGLTWGTDTKLTSISTGATDPCVVASGNTVHIAWGAINADSENYDIYYQRSTDNGQTWGVAINLSNGADDHSFKPALAFSGNNVYAVWYYRSDYQIYYSVSTDSGQTWGTPAQLSQSDYRAMNPAIAAAGSNVFAVWEDRSDRRSNSHIYYNRSTNGGSTWGSAASLSTAVPIANNASVALSGNNVYVIWEDSRSGSLWQVYFRLSSDGGGTWGTETALSAGCSSAFVPVVTVSGSNVYVVWEDNRGTTTQLYYNHSTNGGQTWAGDAQLSSSPSWAGTPYAAASSSNVVHVVWGDARDSSQCIYYKRNSSAAPAQANTTSASISTTLGSVSINIDNGSISNSSWVPPGNIMCSAPNGYIFPYGMFSFNITGLSAGQTVRVTLRLPNPMPLGSKYYKCINGNMVDYTSLVTRVDTNTLILALTDGGLGDADGVANGIIVDPGGPAFPLSTTPATHQSSMPTAPQAPVSLSNITIKNASLSAKKVTPGTPVTVTADVANTGTGNGTSVVKVYVNGAEEAQQGVMVNSGGTSTLTFDIIRNEPGTYSVYVGGTSAGSFKIEAFSESDIILFSSMVFVGLAFMLGVIMLWRRQRSEY
jgi:hypothetical protein